ncbi:phosphoribosylanthranilate isomerase [Sulfodiicoccus acidiphilus]|uniref:phosphoribosylanthranilate isomerase n=1 Tax=Sulfodiicoccus acidiphilus TaxID=1670455 RepID=UPI0013155694|nr:phosphoribosylanthranilate isomerase [Sulfodiicoccus acidiphilus]
MLKICGLTRIEDALAARGADMLGVVLEPSSPRVGSLTLLRDIKSEVKVPAVAVRVSGSLEEMFDLARDADYLQIHRVLTNDELEALSSYEKRKILYVPADLKFLNYLKNACERGDLVLVDSPSKTSATDLKVAAVMLSECSKAGLAGGIGLDNLDSYLKLQPYFLDVSRGVEISPGVKDHRKLRELIRRVKG